LGAFLFVYYEFRLESRVESRAGVSVLPQYDNYIDKIHGKMDN